MNIMPSPTEQLYDLLLAQYRGSPNLQKYIGVFASEMDAVHDLFKQMIAKRYYNLARGAQLDVIGYIVGANRVLEGVVVSGNFGYLQAAEALGMGRLDDPLLGGILRSKDDEVDQDVRLSDGRFRNWIDARIIKNTTNINVEDTIAFFRLLLDLPNLMVNITEPEGKNASVLITLERTLNLNEVSLVISLAEHMKPVGVEFVVQDHTGVIETLPINHKAFQ